MCIKECTSKLSVAAPLAKAPPQFEGSCQSKCGVCEGGWELLAVVVIVMVTAQIHKGVELGLDLVVLRCFVDRCLHLQSKPLKHLFVIGE